MKELLKSVWMNTAGTLPTNVSAPIYPRSAYKYFALKIWYSSASIKNVEFVLIVINPWTTKL